MPRFFTIVCCLFLSAASSVQTVKADVEARQLLEQAGEALAKTSFFRVNYRASQQHIAGAPELNMAGSLAFQEGNRYWLTNYGVLFIFSAQMECVSDGTNYLAMLSSRTVQWERDFIKPDFNKTLLQSFLLGGAAPIVASQVATSLFRDNINESVKIPFFENQFSSNKVRMVEDVAVGGKATRHIELTFFNNTNEPLKMDLWLDSATLFPVRRITHHRSDGDVFETYRYELNPPIFADAFSPQRIIKAGKLESLIEHLETPDALLLKACRIGDIRLAVNSLANGADVNTKTAAWDRPRFFTPLMFATQTGNFDMVKLLVERGAELNVGASGGVPPLYLACMSGKIEQVEYLIEHGASLTNATAALCVAASRGYSNIVGLLVNNGVPVNQSAGELGTPLQRAVQGGFLDIAAFLIAHGADINKSERGSPILHSAVRSGAIETVKFLLKAGAKPDERDSYGMTPIMCAASGNHAAAASLLLEHGADPQLKDSRGKTAMDMISRHSPNKEIVTIFEQKGLIKAVQPKDQKP